MITTILTEAAFLAIIPAAALMYVLLDRYATPRVPESIFDERNLLVAFVAGIPGGLPLAVLFLIYAGSLQQWDLVSAGAYLLLFVAVAMLSRVVLLKIRRFGGKSGRLRTAPFYALAFGCGNAVVIVLAAADSSLPNSNPLYAFGAFLLLSAVLCLVEAWAGIRFARRNAPTLRVLSISSVEALMLVAIAPLYLGVQYVQFASMLGMFLLALLLLQREDRDALHRLLSSRRLANKEPSAFGRTDSDPSTEGESDPTGDK